MKEKIEKLLNSRFGKETDKFINSIWYVFSIGAVCIFSHSLDIPVVGAALLTLLLVPALIFCKNSFVLIPFLMMCAFVLSDKTTPQSGYYNTPLRISVLCILLVFIVAAFVFNIVYYGKWKRIFKRAYLTISLAVLSAALLTGGLASPLLTVGGFTTALSIAAVMFLPYSLLVNCGEYQGRKTVEYFAWSAVTASVAIGAGMLKQYLISDIDIFGSFKMNLKLGYVGPNTGAAIVTIAIPLTFYLVYASKYGYLYMLFVALEMGIIAMTFSRASLVVAVPGTVVVAIVMCFKKKEGRLGYWIAFGIALAIVLIIAIVYRHALYRVFLSMFEGDSTGNGRTDLWKSGLKVWKDEPILGGGWSILVQSGHYYYSYHCTPLTYLYCSGLVGLAAYGYHRYRTVRLVFTAKLTSERVFVALSVLAMLLNALLDIAMTSPTHLLYYAIMLSLIECDANKIKANCKKSEAIQQDGAQPPEEQSGELPVVRDGDVSDGGDVAVNDVISENDRKENIDERV
ncbi:MAG: O-antigen ligase family protein [Roseburia sp.]|nr:O-antigen ligase family protein [Roseburia sp.]